jgi:hypothetical protein
LVPDAPGRAERRKTAPPPPIRCDPT